MDFTFLEICIDICMIWTTELIGFANLCLFAVGSYGLLAVVWSLGLELWHVPMQTAQHKIDLYRVRGSIMFCMHFYVLFWRWGHFCMHVYGVCWIPSMGMSCFLVQNCTHFTKVSCFSVHFCSHLSPISCFVCFFFMFLYICVWLCAYVLQFVAGSSWVELIL